MLPLSSKSLGSIVLFTLLLLAFETLTTSTVFRFIIFIILVTDLTICRIIFGTYLARVVAEVESRVLVEEACVLLCLYAVYTQALSESSSAAAGVS
jgi:hypothetical protein